MYSAIRKISKLFLAPKEIIVKENEPLRYKTTFRIGGCARYFIIVNSVKALSKLLKFFSSEGIEFFVLGGGSNLLVNDHGVSNKVVLSLSGEFKRINHNYLEDGILLESGALVALPSLSKYAMSIGASGLEFGVAIPGSVGGAIIMNAGAHGHEIKDVITEVTVMESNGEIKKLSNKEAGFKYRKSDLGDYVVLFSKFFLKKDNKEAIREKMKSNLIYRSNTQPKGFSAGSVFKNPGNLKAWKLIKDVGLGGYRIGDVMFSEKHTNFIINLETGKASDVVKLIELAKNKVLREHSIDLEPEIKFLGF